MSVTAIERTNIGRSSELDVAGLGRTLSRHRWWVIGPTLAALLLAVIAVNLVKPRYTAEARVLLENQESYFTRPEKQTIEQIPLPDPEAVQSQVQLLTSRDLARKAIRAIGLQGNPEFDPVANGIGALSRVLILLGLQKDPTLLSPEERILEKYFDRLTVYSPTKTRVLSIEFQSSDPDLAARAANTIADLYLDAQAGAKRESARVAATALANQLTNLKVRLADAEARAEAFRAKSGLYVGANNTPITNQQLAEINTQLSNARTAQADAQAKARIIRDMVRQGRIGDVPDVANNDLIRRLSEQRVNLRAQIALEARTLLPGHPRMKELHAQLADLESELRRAAEKTIRTLENDARIAGGRVDNLQQYVEQQKKIAGAQSADEVQLRDYERTVRLLRDQVESDTTKYQEAVARESGKAAPADARIVSRAVAPQLPTYPRKLPIIVFATVAAFVLSTGFILARELLSGRAYTGRETFAARTVHAVARKEDVPAVAEANLQAHEPVVNAPADEVSEISEAEEQAFARAFKTSDIEPAHLVPPAVVARLQETHEPGRAMRILVTSPGDESNAQESAIETARALSKDGRVVLVALAQDLSDLHEEAGREDHLGLTDLLVGHASFAEVIHRDADSSVHFIPAGQAPDRGLDGFDLVLDALCHTYDFIVLLAGRVAAESDAITLAPQVNAVMLAIGQSSSEEAATKAYGDLVEAGARDVVLVGRDAGPEQSAA
ncbi:MAG: lipopolysaccharide biosynthesis protein [Methylobacteriaceae bacterium]|nr:lipopolysaccharide biosynthesis protein [Methylobacteriaceae bacterium]